MTRRFWLSFADSNRPKGQQFLGVAIVEVTDDDATAAQSGLPRSAQPDAEWIAAAAAKAWEMGCNPGGQVAAVDITDTPPTTPDPPLYRLLSKAELRRLNFA